MASVIAFPRRPSLPAQGGSPIASVADTRRPREDHLSLDGEGLDEHFRAWFGRSGRRYIVTVHPLEAGAPAFDYEGALLLAVRREADGAPVLIDARDSGEAGFIANAAWFAEVRGLGANELHVHLLARDRMARQRMLSDLVA